LLDDAGQVLQRLSFNATAVTASDGGVSGCSITIGKGGQFEKLDSELLAKLVKQGGGAACICFLPGTHRLDGLKADGGQKARLSLHGCGHASVLRSESELSFVNFVAIELRDLVIQAEGEGTVVFQKNGEVRLASVQIDRPRDNSRIAALNIAGAERVSVTGCAVTVAMPAVAAVFQDIGGDCRIVQNRFVGIVSFYGDAAGVPTDDVLRKLSSLSRNLRFEAGAGQLTFSDNTVSMLTVGTGTIARLLQSTASGLFATAVLHGNTFVEQSNLFAANMLGFASNGFITVPAGGLSAYGVMIANTASATGNFAVRFGESATLYFVTPDPSQFARAANRVFIQPTKNVADT
jgi:hypothetical protein